MNYRRIAVAVIVFAGMCAAVALLSISPIDWSQWQPATCMPAGCFCEAVQEASSVRQPANTWSSMAYALVGVLVIAHAPAGGANRMRSTRLHPFIFGISAIAIGLGSAFYHASFTFIGQFFDVFGMYLLTTYMLLYALLRLDRLSEAQFGMIYFVIMLVLSVLLIALPDVRRYAFAFILIAAIIVELVYIRLRRARLKTSLFYTGIALFALAFGIWILDNTRVLCAPASALQGHVAWHVLGAVAAALLYFYYLSELPAGATVSDY